MAAVDAVQAGRGYVSAIGGDGSPPQD